MQILYKFRCFGWILLFNGFGLVAQNFENQTSFEEAIEFNYKIIDSNGIYNESERIPINLHITNKSTDHFNVTLTSKILSDHLDNETIYDATSILVEIPSNETVKINYTFTSLIPGFYRIENELLHSNEERIQQSYQIGSSPELIKTTISKPDNFDKFWDARKLDLATIDPKFQLIPQEDSPDTHDLYLVEMRSYGNVLIRGWYSVPTIKGKHPVILHLPGYNGEMKPIYYHPNIASLSLNIRGHGNSKDNLDPKDMEYMFIGMESELIEDYVYIGAYLDCIRAVDFLISREEIDHSLIGVSGGSQGGGLAFATAALDARIAFCNSDIPWMGDWLSDLACGYWPRKHYPEFLATNPELTVEDMLQVLSYVDTVNLAPWIRCPVLMSIGLQDRLCPPRTSFATYNAVTSKKEVRVYPYIGHGSSDELWEYKRDWILRQVKLESK